VRDRVVRSSSRHVEQTPEAAREEVTLNRIAARWHRLMVRTSLQRRVSVMAGAFLAVVLVLTAVLLHGVWVSVRDDGSSEETHAVQDTYEQLEAMRETFVELNSTHTLFVISGDGVRWEERSDLEEALADEVPVLRVKAEATKDDEVREQVGAIIDGVGDWRVVADRQADLKRAGRQQEVDAITARTPASSRFLSAYGAMEDLAHDLREQNRESLDEAEEERDRVLWTSVGVAFTALLLVPAALHLVRRWVLRPLGHLSEQFDRVGRGDLQTPVALAGPPELAAVAASAETMRRRILDELADAVSAREALKQGQPLVEEVRGQLAAHELPVITGWSAAAALRPAEGLLAGDWYDVLPLQDGRYAVVVADVSGHGARAGIVAIQLKRLLEAALHLAPEPDLALAMAARVFSDEAERFASCVVAVVHPDSGVVTYANAGHPAPFVLRSDEGELRVVSELEATGPLLSWLHLDVPGAWGTRTVSMAPGSSLVVYTDGLTEARPTGSTDELGLEGVLRALAEVPRLTPEVIVDEALDVARRWSGGRARDDVTLVVLARHAAAAAGAGVGLPTARDGEAGAR